KIIHVTIEVGLIVTDFISLDCIIGFFISLIVIFLLFDFFFNQMTAYDILSCLVVSEMIII
ncbi:hypothetical protein A0I89_13120, partial [Listeria monocytogenes]